MPHFRISVNGLLPCNVIQAALISLLELRLRLRRRLRIAFPNESTMLVMQRFAKYESDWWKLEHWETSTPEQLRAELGECAESTFETLRSSSEYLMKMHANSKTAELCTLCWRLEYYFRLARASESEIENPDFDRIRDDASIAYFDPQKKKIDDLISVLNMDAETLLNMAFVSGQSLGIIEGVHLQAKNVAAAGGVARAKIKAAEVSEARTTIRKYILKEIELREVRSADYPAASRLRPKLSAESIASAMIHGEMSKLGHAKLASIASKELATFTS